MNTPTHQTSSVGALARGGILDLTRRTGDGGFDPPPSVAGLMQQVPELLGLLRRLGIPYEDARDAVQEALLRGSLWIESGRFHALTNRRAWLRSVAVRAAR